jgi:hypothetical protein
MGSDGEVILKEGLVKRLGLREEEINRADEQFSLWGSGGSRLLPQQNSKGEEYRCQPLTQVFSPLFFGKIADIN